MDDGSVCVCLSAALLIDSVAGQFVAPFGPAQLTDLPHPLISLIAVSARAAAADLLLHPSRFDMTCFHQCVASRPGRVGIDFDGHDRVIDQFRPGLGKIA